MRKYAVIVAGGSGTRMGGGMPKQFRPLCNRPVLWWSMKAFHDEDPQTRLILVLPREFITLWQDFYTSLPHEDHFAHEIATGGASRTESVKNGLQLIEFEEDALVAVHDGARPLVTASLISKGWDTARKYNAAVPAVPVTDSLRCVESYPSVAVDRDKYVAVQTPQVFRVDLLKEAYRKAGDQTFSDDASAVENLGREVTLFEGEGSNIKITNPKDMAVAETLLSDKR